MNEKNSVLLSVELGLKEGTKTLNLKCVRPTDEFILQLGELKLIG